MNTQTITGIIIGAVAVTAIATFAGYELANEEEYAEVISVEPRYITQSVPSEQCREELATTQKPIKDKHQVTGTIAGAIIGGAVGSQIGGGSGKDIATAAGAVAGGYAGNKVHENIQENATEQTVREVCRTVQNPQRIQDGYLVTYELEGQQRTVTMDHDPGRRIPLEDGSPQFN
jgi:uncharacterized protein YcfJ